MEAGEDPAFLKAMNKARIRGALVGVESVTQEGLKDVYKGFNVAGDELVARLREFKRHGVHVLGSFIFGLPSDRHDTFEATAALAHDADIDFAQFVTLTPFPGTIDFQKWEQNDASAAREVDGVPLKRYWLIPQSVRPKIFSPHPTMTAEEIRLGAQSAWGSASIRWGRCGDVRRACSRSSRVWPTCWFPSCIARCTPNTGIATRQRARVEGGVLGAAHGQAAPARLRRPADAEARSADVRRTRRASRARSGALGGPRVASAAGFGGAAPA